MAVSALNLHNVRSDQEINHPSSTNSPSSTNWVLEKLNFLWNYINFKNSFLRKVNMRVHKFQFQWDLVLHLLICLFSLTPFLFTGERMVAILPLSVWLFYNVLVMVGPRQTMYLHIPGFVRPKHSFKTTIEDFFSPKLLPVLSVSFLLVALSLSVTGHTLGGPPLCYQSCGTCLSSWSNSIKMPTMLDYDPYRVVIEPSIHPYIHSYILL